jgi:hypothetical protein
MSDAHVFTLTRPLTRSEMHSHALATLTHKTLSHTTSTRESSSLSKASLPLSLSCTDKFPTGLASALAKDERLLLRELLLCEDARLLHLRKLL